MGLSATLLTADFNFMVSDYPQSFSTKGTPYSCIGNDLVTGQVLDDEGFREQVTVELIAGVSQFGGTLPAANQVITYNGKEYRVASTGPAQSVDGVSVTLPLVAKTS
jgi:bacillopeptidase F (M6 metalloprotease family)